jgi:plastocyanin
MDLKALAMLMLGGQAFAKTIRIDVGKDGNFAFDPDNVTAAKGDMLEYHFHGLNHSVVAGDFKNPCQPAKSGGFNSGFMPVSGDGEAVSSAREDWERKPALLTTE